ncbi:MAG TPA: nuclear transport factor 2 family protein [Actinomycetota bacterium]|nr:nuclear transport factor 2 family protein [Actinomycetota bacterium]
MSDQDLLDRNDAWEKAIRDRDPDAAREVLAEDYALVLVHPAPAVVTRDEWIAMLPDYVVHEWTVEERQVDVVGDLAAVLQRVQMRATVNGIDRSGLFAISDVWRRLDGQWRVWRRHSTPFSAGELK